MTPTLAICLGAGVTAGIALARPATQVPPAPAAVTPAAPASVGDVPPTVEPAGSDTPAAPAALGIAGFEFDPITVAPGQTVVVTNADGAPHTVTDASGAFDTGTIGAAAAGSFVAPIAPGTYSIVCVIHPSMQGQLVVSG